MSYQRRCTVLLDLIMHVCIVSDTRGGTRALLSYSLIRYRQQNCKKHDSQRVSLVMLIEFILYNKTISCDTSDRSRKPSADQFRRLIRSESPCSYTYTNHNQFEN